MSASVVSSLCVVMPVWTSPGLRTHRTQRQGAVPEPAAESEYSSAHPPCVRVFGGVGWSSHEIGRAQALRARQARLLAGWSVSATIETGDFSLVLGPGSWAGTFGLYKAGLTLGFDLPRTPKTESSVIPLWSNWQPNRSASAAITTLDRYMPSPIAKQGRGRPASR